MQLTTTASLCVVNQNQALHMRPLVFLMDAAATVGYLVSCGVKQNQGRLLCSSTVAISINSGRDWSETRACRSSKMCVKCVSCANDRVLLLLIIFIKYSYYCSIVRSELKATSSLCTLWYFHWTYIPWLF